MDKVLWTGEYEESWEQKFNEMFEVTKAGFAACKVMPTDYREHVLRGEVLQKALEGKDIFMIGVDPLKEEILKASPDLKLILSVRDGPEENVDIKTCTELGIPVISSAGRCSVSVAEFTFELMMLLARPAHLMSTKARAMKWTNETQKTLRGISTKFASELCYKTVGIIGLGRNGLQIAKRCQAFDMKVVGYDPFVKPEVLEKENIEGMSLNELMKTADYVIVMARVTPQSIGLVGKEQIDLMKPTACLINTARAALVDYDALYQALKEERVYGAALDTWPTEPLGPDSPFYDLPEERIIITPHAAGFTKERTFHQYELLTSGYNDFVNGVVPRGLVNKDVFDSPNFAARGGIYWNKNNKKG